MSYVKSVTIVRGIGITEIVVVNDGEELDIEGGVKELLRAQGGGIVTDLSVTLAAEDAPKDPGTAKPTYMEQRLIDWTAAKIRYDEIEDARKEEEA